jgi:hypothetical protein
MKSIIKQVANDYTVNPKALKRYVKESQLKPKEASRLQVLQVLYINCTNLFYCRESDCTDGVEFQDFNLLVNLIDEMDALKEIEL